MMTNLSVNCRRAAALNPLSTITNNTYEELAAANGMDSAYEYLHSKFNPLIGKYMRGSHFEQRCDGAAAILYARQNWLINIPIIRLRFLVSVILMWRLETREMRCMQHRMHIVR
mgnify:CR=1 FL=1